MTAFKVVEVADKFVCCKIDDDIEFLINLDLPRGLIQPCLVAFCKKSTRNQPISNPHIGKPTVGFAKTNRVPTFVYHSL